MGSVASARWVFAKRLPPFAGLHQDSLSFLLSTGPAKASPRGSLSKGPSRATPPRIRYGIPDTPVRPRPPAPTPFIAWLEARVQRLANLQEPLPTLADMLDAGLPAVLVDEVNALLAQGEAEGPLIAAVLYGLLLRPSSGRTSPRKTLRRLRFTATRGLPRDQMERLVALAKSCLPPMS